jgi:hypothetical protein
MDSPSAYQTDALIAADIDLYLLPAGDAADIPALRRTSTSHIAEIIERTYSIAYCDGPL